MKKYIIRTKDGKTHLFQVRGKNELIGYINYDFILRRGALPVRCEVRGRHGTRGWVETFYPSASCIKVYNRRKEEVAYLERPDRLRIDGVYISFLRLSKEETILAEERQEKGKVSKKLEEAGLTHSYVLDDSKLGGRIYCFARKGDISTFLYTDTAIEPGIDELLRFLPLAISKRVFEQEFVRRFMGM